MVNDKCRKNCTVCSDERRQVAKVFGTRADVRLLQRRKPVIAVAAQLRKALDELLPLLVLDWQLPAAGPLLTRLDGGQLVAEVRYSSQPASMQLASLSCCPQESS